MIYQGQQTIHKKFNIRWNLCAELVGREPSVFMALFHKISRNDRAVIFVFHNSCIFLLHIASLACSLCLPRGPEILCGFSRLRGVCTANPSDVDWVDYMYIYFLWSWLELIKNTFKDNAPQWKGLSAFLTLFLHYPYESILLVSPPPPHILSQDKQRSKMDGWVNSKTSFHIWAYCLNRKQTRVLLKTATHWRWRSSYQESNSYTSE